MARVVGKAKNGNRVSIDFPTRRAADRFVDIWNGVYLDTFRLEIIDFA